jgi:hypothetical protein
LHFCAFLQLRISPNFLCTYTTPPNRLRLGAFRKAFILSFLNRFSQNKKHTNLNTSFYLYGKQKPNEINLKQRILYKPKLSHFYNFNQKSPFRSSASNKKRNTGETMLVTMAILVSKWSSKSPLFPYNLKITLRENAHRK